MPTLLIQIFGVCLFGGIVQLMRNTMDTLNNRVINNQVIGKKTEAPGLPFFILSAFYLLTGGRVFCVYGIANRTMKYPKCLQTELIRYHPLNRVK